MGYNNYNSRGNSYPRENRGQYAPQYVPKYAPQQKQIKKHSGAKMGIGRNEKPYLTGWNVSKKGFISLISCPANEPVHSSKGNLLKTGWERWVCSIEFKPNDSYLKQKSTHTGFYNTATRKLYVPDLTMVINPNAPNGGYFGTCKKPVRR